ncbi:hypothetical protein E2C01_090111 [Portunus trituberculatus]|uniref:Uncharacterized protein n=1 Tax=Portunus trituberculatus TaxID=210409 RepID=A0A5B7JDT7_PORTR|nr:hypothetical protein [Portunus trituberculatus]
MSFWVKSAL